ncbi:hypothetical protein OG594_45950 [Streptomyces sp. NBC_01214]|uniref:hypothetical protein n=1 Tax=Streptomyces sp. NBC_01214 TaxID=2903777 RepID=UPI002257BBC3|nr:hypothetical protein [Streptomyces sp. NBC_01214]MCX4808810.1 hypothetical protein [Streptomyces sp. NBC_01214]
MRRHQQNNAGLVPSLPGDMWHALASLHGTHVDPVGHLVPLDRTHMQPLRDAIGNPRRDAVLARRAERVEPQQAEYQEKLRRAAEQRRAERGAARPACAGCGTTFDNDRWENTQLSPEPGNRWYPKLCEPCEADTVAAADQAERNRLEAEAAATAEKARGWRSRFRPGQAS